MEAKKIVFLKFPCREVVCEALESPEAIDPKTQDLSEYANAHYNAMFENEPQKHISEVLKEAERSYQCVKSETLRTVREADGKWHTYFMDDEIGTDLSHYQINHIPAARKKQAADEVVEILRYMNRINGNHIADADYYLAEMRDGIRQSESARRKKNAKANGEGAENKPERKIKQSHYTTGAAETVATFEQTETNESVIATTPTETTDTANVSGEGEKEAERAENDQNPTAADIAQMVKTELDKNKAMRTVWHLEFPDGDECLVRYNYTLPEPYGDQYIYEEARDGHVFFSVTCGWKNIPSWICIKLGIEPPQSPETPQTAEHTTDTDKDTEKQTQSVCEHLATL